MLPHTVTTWLRSRLFHSYKKLLVSPIHRCSFFLLSYSLGPRLKLILTIIYNYNLTDPISAFQR